MDVLGLLSNISQVVDLLIKIGVMCSIYCYDVKNAPKDVRKLLKEVDRLTVVVKELEFLLKGPKGAKIESPALRQTFFDLRRLLAELVAKLDLGAKNTRAIWPFRKREVHDILASIERQKANIVLNINIEQTSILLDVHQEMVLSKLRVAEAATFDSSVDGEESYCLQGTRSQIIEQIQHWSIEQDGQSIFWLNGMAGTGKSTISRTIAQRFANEDILGASFFFKRGEGDRGRTAFLFTTIAAQLVRRLPCLAPHIREVLDIDPSIHEKPLLDQFQKLILDPLKKSSGCWPSPSLVIVIDALDECGIEENMRNLITIFSKAQHTDIPRLKFFLTSRPELPIRLGFEEIGGKYDNLLLAAVPAPTIGHDIEIFMRSKLHSIKADYNMSVTEHRKIASDWPGEDVVQKLVAAAVPLFIIAATMCRFLSDRRLGGPHHQLSKLLEYQKIQTSGLDMTYLPVLDRLVVGLSPSDRQEVLNRFRYLIGSIITLARPLSIRSLSHLLEVSTDVIEDQLDLLHSVLGVPTDLDTPVRLLHLSFRDFLVDSEKQQNLIKYPFWVDEEEAHSRLFSQCLRLLSYVLKEDICGLQLPGTLRSDISQDVIDNSLPSQVQYACMYWPYHLTLSKHRIRDGDEIHQFLLQHLLHWLEALSLMGRSAESVYMIDDLLDRLENTNTQVAEALLQDVRRFILANVGTMNKAPLQIYSSALIFAPEASIVRKRFETSAPSWLSALPVVQSHWDPCLVTLDKRVVTTSKILTFPTGNRCLSISPGGMLNIWDTKTTSCIATYEGVLDGSVKLSSDGLLYLAGNQVLQIIDAKTRNPIAEFRGHTDKIRRAMFSADSQLLASASIDGILKIWDRETRSCLATYNYNYDTDRIIGFSPDGSTFLIISNFNSVQLLHSRKNGLKSLINDDSRLLVSVVFSPDSQILVFINDSGNLKFRNMLSGTILVAKTAYQATHGDLVFFSNSDRCISPMKEHAIGIWNTATAKCDCILEGHCASISDIILSRDESRIVSASYDKTIRIWDSLSGACTAIYNGHDEQIISIAYSPDERLLISADNLGNCKVWDIGIEAQPATIDSHESAVLEIIFSPDLKRIATTSGDRTLKLWNATNRECMGTGNDHQIFAWVPLIVPQDMASAPFDHIMGRSGLYGWPRSVEFSLESAKLISATMSGGLRLWNAKTGDYEHLLQESNYSFRSVRFSPDGETLISTVRDGRLMYWDMKELKLIDSFGGTTYDVSSSIHSPDGTYLICACDDGVVRLWYPQTGIVKELDENHGKPVRLLALSADGTKLASSSITMVKIWDLDGQTCVVSYPAVAPFKLGGISQMEFSPDSQRLAILYEKGEVKIDILDVGTGRRVDGLSICGLANHMAFDSTGSNLITNVGTFILDPPNPSHEPAIIPNRPNSSSSREPNAVGIGLSRDGEWVTWNSISFLWLPPTFRASASDIATSTLALGSRFGRLLLVEIEPSMVPASMP